MHITASSRMFWPYQKLGGGGAQLHPLIKYRFLMPFESLTLKVICFIPRKSGITRQWETSIPKHSIVRELSDIYSQPSFFNRGEPICSQI